MIGTNNSGWLHLQHRYTVDGIIKILQILHNKFPYAHIILCNIIPQARRDVFALNTQINDVLYTFKRYDFMTIIDMRQQYVTDDMTMLIDDVNSNKQRDHVPLNDTLFHDGLHLSEQGYDIWSNNIRWMIDKYVK